MSGDFSRYVGVCSAEHRDAVNLRLAAARHPEHKYLYGPDNLRIPCSATGQEPATHYAVGFAADGAMMAQIEGLRAIYPSIAIYLNWEAAAEAGILRIVPPLSP